ncbi:MAG: PorP/SprF family type IX secretion system membrane protein [Bacteroidota bacterium]|nr:PorP/SprF family type IX secretion system membrane protein [Bacteroidota bacterium]
MKTKRYFIYFCCVIGFSLTAQDVHFSQFNDAPLQMNPALTGNFSGTIRSYVNYKSQWAAYSKAYSTMSAAVDAHLMQTKGRSSQLGIGLFVYNDKSANKAMGLTRMMLSIAAIRQLSKHHILSAGLQAGLVQRSLRPDKLSWNNQYDGTSYNPGLSSLEDGLSLQRNFADFSAGLNWHYSKSEKAMTFNDKQQFNFGVALHHLSKPDQSFYADGKDPLNFCFIFQTNYLFGIANSNLSLVPSVYAAFQGAHKEITGGLACQYELKNASKYTGQLKSAHISFGAYYRVLDAMIFNMGLNVGDYSLGVSYDLRAPGLGKTGITSGGPELMLRFQH